MLKRFLRIPNPFQARYYFATKTTRTDNLNFLDKSHYEDRNDDDEPFYSQSLPQGRFRESQTIDKSEIETRILKVCRDFPEINIRQMDWTSEFKKVGLDSLSRIAVLTCVEQEFSMIFPDNVFENLKTFGQVAEYVGQDIKAF